MFTAQMQKNSRWSDFNRNQRILRHDTGLILDFNRQVGRPEQRRGQPQNRGQLQGIEPMFRVAGHHAVNERIVPPQSMKSL